LGVYLLRTEAETQPLEPTEGDLSFRNKIIGTASALALAACIASPAFAMDGFNGLLGADYSHISINHGGGNANDYGANATGMFDVGSQFALQADGGYHHLDISNGGGNTNDWNIAGTGFWTGGMGRVGATVGYNSSNGGGSDVHATNYGAFGNWYATRSITFGIKGGGFNASGNTKGDYAGAALTGYVTPDLSLQGGYDYTHLQHAGNENDWSAKVEYLFSERTPIAIYAGYTDSKIGSGGPTISVFSIGLTYFCDPTGPESLIAHERGGAEQWGNSFGPTLLKF
jgi:hypothetical protein